MDSISSCNYKDVQHYIDRFPGCTWKKLSNKPLGRGVSGVVYQICCDDYCENIVKIIERKTSDIEKFKKTVKKEIYMQDRFAELGLAPEIYKAYLCDHEAVIIMDKVNNNIYNYIMNVVDDVSVPIEQILSHIDELQEGFLKMINKGFDNGIVHDDLHIENLAIKDDILFFLDFGKSFEEQISKSDREERIEDFILTFKKLKKDAALRRKSVEANLKRMEEEEE